MQGAEMDDPIGSGAWPMSCLEVEAEFGKHLFAPGVVRHQAIGEGAESQFQGSGMYLF
jgi:hypothetical protein